MAERALSGRLDRMVDTILARGDATAALQDPELAPLAGLVVELRHYPNPEFTARLKARLKGRTTMSTAVAATTPTTTRAREGFTTVTPYHPDERTRGWPVSQAGVRRGGNRDHDGAATARAPRAAGWRLDDHDRRGRAGRRGAGASRCVSPLRRGCGRRRSRGARGRRRRRSASRRTARTASGPASSRTCWATTGTSAARLSGPAVPEGLRTVTPYLHPKGAPAYIEFLKQAFGAMEDARHLAPRAG